jgi:hypothetical protein
MLTKQPTLRFLIVALFAAPLALPSLSPVSLIALAEAKDGGGGGGGGGSGPGGNSGSGSANSGNQQGSTTGSGNPGTGGSGIGRQGGRNGSLWGSTGPDVARAAVNSGAAVPLSTVLPVVRSSVPGEVLEVDLRQAESGDWRYFILVPGRDRQYHEVLVDARSSRVLGIRRR